MKPKGEVVFTKHAREKAEKCGITLEKARELFGKAEKRELKRKVWAYKFGEHGLKEAEAEHYYYSGWNFVASQNGEKLIVLTISYPCRDNIYLKEREK